MKLFRRHSKNSQRKVMFILLRKYEFSEKIIRIILKSYWKYIYKVQYKCNTTKAFTANSSVRPGLLLSLAIFLLAIDELM